MLTDDEIRIRFGEYIFKQPDRELMLRDVIVEFIVPLIRAIRDEDMVGQGGNHNV